MRIINEATDVKKIIKDMQGNFGGSNEDQMKSLQLLKGLATSDDKLANTFMKKLDKATTSISKEVLGGKKEESIIVKGNGTILDIDKEYSVELEEGKEYIIKERV